MKTTKQAIAEQQALNRKIWAKENGRLHHIDANKLIAEFMGLNIGRGVQSDYMQHELKYHTSWDWLMPVIDKCYQEYMSKHIAEAVMTCDIDVAYKVVVEFINEYNKDEI